MTVIKPKVTCFHDGECPIYAIEINAMKKLDKTGNVKWVNIAQDKTALATAGLTYRQAMERMYVIDENQQLQSGVLGFLQLWKQLPYYLRITPILENIPLLLPDMEFFYGIFARYRLQLTGRSPLKKE